MYKAISLPKNLKRFRPCNKWTLLLLQGFTFGIFNARQKLKKKGYTLRQSDVVTCLIVGELSEPGCKISNLKNTLGYQTSVARNALTRSTIRGLTYKIAGSKGRGHAANYYLTEKGLYVYKTLQTELGKTFDAAKRDLTRTVARLLKAA